MKKSVGLQLLAPDAESTAEAKREFMNAMGFTNISWVTKLPEDLQHKHGDRVLGRALRSGALKLTKGSMKHLADLGYEFDGWGE
jgi:hypothetical protein